MTSDGIAAAGRACWRVAVHGVFACLVASRFTFLASAGLRRLKEFASLMVVREQCHMIWRHLSIHVKHLRNRNPNAIIMAPHILSVVATTPSQETRLVRHRSLLLDKSWCVRPRVLRVMVCPGVFDPEREN